MTIAFKINFIDPGKNLPRVEPQMERIQRFFYKRMGLSVSLLTIFFVFILSSAVFYFQAIYLPLEKELEEKKQHLAQVEADYKMKTGLRLDKAKKARNVLAIIDKIDRKKSKTFNWSDCMNALDRTLVKNLWLSSLEVQDNGFTPAAKKPGPVKKNSKTKTNDNEKKVEARGYLVTIRGATYANPARKPLKTISRFMTNLVDEPYWGNYFFLKDWSIDSSEKIVTFEVILESKSL